MRFILWEMLGSEFLVRHVELLGVEHLYVGLPGTLDVSGAPAGVYEFPFVVIDAYGVPGVVAVIRWKR